MNLYVLVEDHLKYLACIQKLCCTKTTFLRCHFRGWHWKRHAVESTVDLCFLSHSLYSTCSRRRTCDRSCPYEISAVILCFFHVFSILLFLSSLSLCLVCTVEFLGIMWLLCTFKEFLSLNICGYLKKPNFSTVSVCVERRRMRLYPFKTCHLLSTCSLIVTGYLFLSLIVILQDG